MNIFEYYQRRDHQLGERISYYFRWVIYFVLCAFSLYMYFNKSINYYSRIGVIFPLCGLLYNIILIYYFVKDKYYDWLWFLSVTVDLAMLTAYIMVSAKVNPLIISMLSINFIYPIIILITILRNEQKLTIYAIIMAVIFFNIPYVYYYDDIVLRNTENLFSVTITGQLFKSIFIVITGLILLTIPKKINMLLVKQREMYEEMYGQIKVLNSDLEIRNSEISNRLYFDPLTGLPNRYSLFTQIHFYQNPVLMIININSFKEINDFYGCKMGDSVLRELAILLEKNLKNEKRKIYRLAADEFAIITEYNDDIQSLHEETEKVNRLVNDRPLIINDTEIFIRVTIGTAIADINPDETRTFESVIVNADMALKRAKSHRKSYVIYDKSMQIIKEFENNINWVKKLKHAIALDNIVPYYQPIINNSSQLIDKYECLIRLIDEEGKIIAPYAFLEIAQKSGLYPELTQIMFSTAFKKFKNTEYEFSLNLAVDDILNGDTTKYIIKSLKEDIKVCPRIVFELLESQEIDSYKEIRDFIDQVRDFGCKIAIDDFGAGYSNFAHLLHLKSNYIKIDSSLIKNIHNDVNSQIMVKTISSFASELNLETVAEFVHCQEVYDKVKELGITYSQGYFIGEPKPELLLKK